jgi:hypothetical protein
VYEALLKSVGRKRLEGSTPSFPAFGRVSEWIKEHVWKACLGKTNVGSNPISSAKWRASELVRSAFAKRVTVKRFGVRASGSPPFTINVGFTIC